MKKITHLARINLLLGFARDAITWRREVELYRDGSLGGTEYGIRLVWRHRLSDAMGWRHYKETRHSIAIPRDCLRSIIRSSGVFLENWEEDLLNKERSENRQLRQRIKDIEAPRMVCD